MTSPSSAVAVRFVVCCCVALGAARAQESRPARPADPTPRFAGWWDDLFADVPTTLAAVRAAPESFRGKTLGFEIQFRRTVRLADAFHTDFDAKRYLDVVAWDGAAELWDERAFRAEHAFLFIRHDHPEAPALRDAPPYARFAVRAKVVETIRGEPWIELLSATPLEGRLTEAALLRVAKADRLRAFRKFEAAAEEFVGADDARLPTALRVRFKREAADCFEAAQRPLAAAATLRHAQELAPEDDAVARRLSALRAALRGDPNGERPGGVFERAPASRPKDD